MRKGGSRHENGINTHISVQAQSRGHTDGEICEQTHQEGRESGDGGGGGDEVSLDISETGIVGGVSDTTVASRALARSSGVGEDRCVHGNLGHIESL